MINEYNAFSCSGFDQSALHGAVHRSLSVYKRVFLVLRCQNFHDLKPLCYSYDRVTSLISNFLGHRWKVKQSTMYTCGGRANQGKTRW